jgi:hypothetical protein
MDQAQRNSRIIYVSNRPITYGTVSTPALANVPGARTNPSAWTDAAGQLWLFGGGGYDGVGGSGYLHGVWVIQSN